MWGAGFITCPHTSVGFPLAFLIALCQHVDMVCIYCTNETRITNSRPQKRLGQTWRRHACEACGAIFTTIEKPDLSGSVRFVTKDTSLVPFDRDVLFVSIVRALGHRGDAVSVASALTATIIVQVLKTAQNGRVERTKLVGTVTETLRRFDAAGAVQYRAYHAD